MSRILFFLAFALAGCGSESVGQSIEIQNFKSGLVCPYQPSHNVERRVSGWICFKTEKVHITGQSKCIFDGVERNCTWYGYEFDYENVSKDDEISCVSEDSEAGTIGNPEKILRVDASTYEYSISLNSESGHYYNPQYYLAKTMIEEEFVLHTQTICSVGNQELFRFQFQLVFPKSSDG